MLLVFLLRPGLLAGALALAVHEFGVLGRLTSDRIDDLDPAPLHALRAAGVAGPSEPCTGHFRRCCRTW